MWDAGLKPPAQPATRRSKCFCGADLTIAHDRSRRLCKSGNGPMKFALDRSDAERKWLAAGAAGTDRIGGQRGLIGHAIPPMFQATGSAHQRYACGH